LLLVSTFGKLICFVSFSSRIFAGTSQIGQGSPPGGEGWKSDPGDTNLTTLLADLKRTMNCALNLCQFQAGFSHLANHPNGSSIAAVKLQFRTIQSGSLAKFHKLCFHINEEVSHPDSTFS
jgi:hypothetical protein